MSTSQSGMHVSRPHAAGGTPNATAPGWKVARRLERGGADIFALRVQDAEGDLVGMTRSTPALAREDVATRRARSDVAPSFFADGRPKMPKLTAADGQRFDRIVAGNLDFIWRCLRRMRIPSSDVDDAVQQVFIVAASKLSGILVGRKRAFLFATASRIAANIGRLIRRRNQSIHF